MRLFFLALIALSGVPLDYHSGLLSIPLAPDPEGLVAEQLHYDGQLLELTGGVAFKHPLAEMRAQSLLVSINETLKNKGGSQPLFSSLALHKDVVFSLHNGAELRCDEASVDVDLLHATLKGKQGYPVLYIDPCNPHSSFSNVQLQGQRVEIDFVPHPCSSKMRYTPSTLHAFDNVAIRVADTFALYATKAVCQFVPLSLPHSPALHALLSVAQLFASESTSCTAFFQDKHTITASSFIWDASAKTLEMSTPQGQLFLPALKSDPEQALTVSCDQALWDQTSEQLYCYRHVSCSHPSLGALFTDDKMIIDQPLLSSSPPFASSLRLEGKSSWSWDEKGFQRQLQWTGECHVDLVSMEIVVNGNKSQKKADHIKVQEEEEICYRDPHVEVFAQKAELSLSKETGKLAPVSMVLTGEVRLIVPSDAEEHCYALADLLEYNFMEDTLILKGKERKALLWDSKHSMALSAEQVQLTSCSNPELRVARGIGSVQFVFNNTEMQLFKHFFPTCSPCNPCEEELIPPL